MPLSLRCFLHLQATPAALANLEASADRPVFMSSRDGKVFFDQLRVPLSLSAYLGRPAIRLCDLLEPPPCESGACAAPGLTEAELASFVLDGPIPSDSIWITPVSNAWPMGFGWSSYVAQSTMVASCRRAGFPIDSFLTGERVLAADRSTAVAVATDDVNVFQRM